MNPPVKNRSSPRRSGSQGFSLGEDVRSSPFTKWQKGSGPSERVACKVKRVHLEIYLMVRVILLGEIA